MKEINITEAEIVIMKVLWKSKTPLSSYQISHKVSEKNWKYTTVSTLLSRLTEKQAIKYEKKGKTYYYMPLIEENNYKILQTTNLVTKMFDGSVKNLVASLYENNQISEQDIKEIKELFKL